MNVETLKKEITAKTKARQDTGLLKYIVAECERYNKQPIPVIEKLIADNKITYEKSKNQKYLDENTVLSQYLPSYLTVDEIVVLLAGLGIPDNSGKSIGMAVKHLKSLNAIFRNEDVVKALSV